MGARTEFFISYNRSDRAWAQWIAWQLRQAGYRTVGQEWDYRPRAKFVAQSHAAVADAGSTIALLSPAYLVREMRQPEWRDLFQQDAEGTRRRILPVRVSVCELRGSLAGLGFVDLVDLDEPTARRVLMEGIVRTWALPVAAEVDATQVPGDEAADLTDEFDPLSAQELADLDNLDDVEAAEPTPLVDDAEADLPPRADRDRPLFPGVPKTWNVPRQRNVNFTGRRQLLLAMRRMLCAGEAVVLTQTILGLGSVGKTQLAMEYAYRFSEQYRAVWWVRSENRTTLAADLAGLATPLGLAQRDDPDQSRVIEAVRHWLTRQPDWLIIFDNAENPDDVRPYLPGAPLPGASGGHVVFTSRHPNWAGIARPLYVEVFEREESIAFLLQQTGQEDRAAADRLAWVLGDLPLALAHAAGHIAAGGQTLGDYVELFRRRGIEIRPTSNPPMSWEDTIATTLSLAVDSVQAASPAAAELLTLCAFFAPDDVPFALLTDQDEVLPPTLSRTLSDPLAFDRAIRVLRRYSLITAGDAELSLHRLVQAVARDRLPADERCTWAQHAMTLVSDAFPDDADAADPQWWPQYDRLLSHGCAAADLAETLGADAEQTRRLRARIEQYLRTRGQ